MNRRSKKALRNAVMLAAAIAACGMGIQESSAKSQMCPVDPSLPCIGGGPAPIPPKQSIVRQTEVAVCRIVRMWGVRCNVR